MPPRRQPAADPSPSADKARKATGKPKNPLGFGLSHPSTSEVQYSGDEEEFLQAIEKYKREKNRNFPTWREVFHVLLSLGYAKGHVPRVYVDEDERADLPDGGP